MKLKKSEEIIKIEEALKKTKEALKKATQKHQQSVTKINSQFTEIILKKLLEDDNFKTDLKNLLTKNDLQNAIDVLNQNYAAFELGQKIEEPKKEEV